MSSERSTVGFHYLVEATGCEAAILRDADRVQEILMAACREGAMEVKTSYFFRFASQGLSGILVLAESHLSIHTWPELGYAALDIFVCRGRPALGGPLDLILDGLGAAHAHVSEVKRGIREGGLFRHAILTREHILEAGRGAGGEGSPSAR